MQIQIVYNDDKVLVKFDREKFKALLNEYFAKTGDFDKAFSLIEEDLKKEILKI